MTLSEDRYFDPDPAIRRIARDLYQGVRNLPLVCPHGHVDPGLLANDEPFPEPTSLILTPDHYLIRMLYSAGIGLERLGIPSRDGTPVEKDPRKIWKLFGENYFRFRGTPSRAWLDYELHELFGVRQRLDGKTAMSIYDHICERLEEPEFRPRALFDRFNIEVLATTDGAADSLRHHQAIRASGWPGSVIPTFRPDVLFQIAGSSWRADLERFARATEAEIGSCSSFIKALEFRREFFKKHGATATDHGVTSLHTSRLSDQAAERLFQAGLSGEATAADQSAFEGHMLMEMARMSLEDGLVMQIHPGVYRNHNQMVHDCFGADRGGDIPLQAEFTRSLQALLNDYGTDARFRLVVFTVDESTYSRELAPMAGHYPALRIGPPWWFFDSIEGMRRHRELTIETAGFYNTAGFNDDTRAFLSIPARHDLARRVDANYLAGLVARHQLDLSEGHDVMRALAYDLVRDTYRLDTRAEEHV